MQYQVALKQLLQVMMVAGIICASHAQGCEAVSTAPQQQKGCSQLLAQCFDADRTQRLRCYNMSIVYTQKTAALKLQGTCKLVQ